MSKILVIGANGNIGSELSLLLTAQGHQVLKATSQKATKADQVHLNLLNQEGLKAAVKGVDKVFLLSPPGYLNQDKFLIPVIDEAKKAGVQKIVLMTAMGVNADDNIPLRIAEKQLESSGLSYNIIRPNWFMQNFNSYWIEGINSEGKILVPVEKAKGSFIDVRDIAAVAAELLNSEKFKNQDFDLTGGESLNHDEAAKILSAVSHRKIVFENISAGQMKERLLGAGLPKDYAEFMLVILEYFRLGYSERITDSVEKITGKKPRTFRAYAEDTKAAWTI